jgi:hypothetical protein
MENYNRLFLLEDPAAPQPGDHDDDVAQLMDQITKGDDVTPPGAKAGKVTLSQLNAYSGEVDIAALTNFKAVKIDSITGNVYETNLAKLLIELQQVGGIEDRREEALIEHGSLSRDLDSDTNKSAMEEKTASRWAAKGLQFLAGDINDYDWTVPTPDELNVIYPSEFTYKTPHSFILSNLEPNGSRRSYIASYSNDEGATHYGYGKDRLIVSLNGIVQDENDGSFLVTQVEGKDVIYGFEFNEAPVVGDQIHFMFDDVVQEATNYNITVTVHAEGYSGASQSHFNDGVKSDFETNTGQWQTAIDEVDITGFTADLELSAAALRDAEDTIKTASTEGEISNALTASTVAYQNGIKASHQIIAGQATIAENEFLINAATVRFAESDLKKNDLLKSLGKEYADAFKLINDLDAMRLLMEQIEGDDGTGGQS